jgi:hypothetical protein
MMTRVLRMKRVSGRAFGWVLAAFSLATTGGFFDARAQGAAPAAPSAPTENVLVTASPITTKADMESIFDQIFTVPLDTEKPLAISGLTLKRDTMELVLTRGTLWLAKPIAGQVTGAYFTGAATLRMSIPSALDRKRLEAAIGRPTIDMGIGEVVLRFDDGTEKEIVAAGKPAGGVGPPGATWNDRLKVDALSDEANPMDFLHTRINGLKHTTLFTADFPGADKAWYRFVHNGGHRIEDTLFKEEYLGAGGKRLNRILAQFHRPGDYDANGNYDIMPEFDVKDVALVRNVDMTVTIPNTKSVAIDAKLTVEALRDNVRGVRFDFVNNLDDSGLWDAKGRPVIDDFIGDANGNALPALHRWHELIVLLPRPLAKGERTVVSVKATEDTIIQLTDKSYVIYTTYPWFPQIGELGGRYTMDWTVKVQKPMVAAGTGDVVKEWEEGGLNCARWKSDVPVQFASFIFGSFKVTQGAYKREAPLSGEVPIRIFTILGGFEHSKANPEAVIYNISQGIKTYETIYGPFPYGQLDVAEMAKYQGFAQAPAGVLLISSVMVGATVFENDDGTIHDFNIEEQGGLGKTGGGGTGDQFVFHELAHQWWGHNVSWVGDEDQWMSEALAEYSAGMMVAAIDPKRFDLMRKGWRKEAIAGDPFGTLATANTSETPEHPGERFRLVYCKGPYVIHMLRTWMGWEKFAQYTTAVQTKYKGQSINNDTLAREAGKVMGYSMFPFFDQWVRDKGIPRVHYTWSVAPDPEGKQVVTVKLRQEDTANPKILMVPIALDFGKKEPTIVQKPLLKAEGEIQLRVPEKPKGLSIDPTETQLAFFVDDAKR